jgi:hypothetical protein
VNSIGANRRKRISGGPLLIIHYLFRFYGRHLAGLEMRIIIEEVMRRMPELKLAGQPERLRPNFLAGIKHIPMRFTPLAVYAQRAFKL